MVAVRFVVVNFRDRLARSVLHHRDVRRPAVQAHGGHFGRFFAMGTPTEADRIASARSKNSG